MNYIGVSVIIDRDGLVMDRRREYVNEKMDI